MLCGRGGVAPPLLDAMYRVHVYLHVLARLERLAADGARVRQLARSVHVEDVLLEVAIVAVELAALGARGLGRRLTVSVGRGAAVRVALLGLWHRLGFAAARPGRSWGRRRLVQCSLLVLRLSSTYRQFGFVYSIARTRLILTSIVAFRIFPNFV